MLNNVIMAVVAFLFCGSCVAESSDYPTSSADRRNTRVGSIFDQGGIGKKAVTFVAGSKEKEKENVQVRETTAPKHEVKSVTPKLTNESKKGPSKTNLWRAALDTVQFMPILVSDSKGGVLSTDWYESEDTPGQRYKVNVIIMSASSDDSIMLKLFKQEFLDDQWRDVKVDDALSQKMKREILAKAKIN